MIIIIIRILVTTLILATLTIGPMLLGTLAEFILDKEHRPGFADVRTFKEYIKYTLWRVTQGDVDSVWFFGFMVLSGIVSVVALFIGLYLVISLFIK